MSRKCLCTSSLLFLHLFLVQIFRSRARCTALKEVEFPGWPKFLDTNLYWFGPGNEPEKATGEKSRFYDPAKPTIIFVHGWTGYGRPSGITACRRWRSECLICHDKRILSTPWLQKGWNYGIFYWDQFADEPCARNVELKIWINPSKPQGLEWKSYDRSTDQIRSEHYYNSSTPSLGHLCAQHMRKALATFHGPTLRFVGHSLGAQLAARCAQLLHQETPQHSAAPSRLILLDPYFTNKVLHWERDVLDSWAGGLLNRYFQCSTADPSHHYGRSAPLATADAVKELWEHNVATELYKGSAYTESHFLGDTAPELETIAAFVVQKLGMGARGLQGYCKNDRVMDRLTCGHSSLQPLYMQRIDDPQPLVKGGQPVGTCTMPGPACSDAQIRTFIREQIKLSLSKQRQMWVQDAGSMTVETDDDTYKFEINSAPTDTRLSLSPSADPISMGTTTAMSTWAPTASVLVEQRMVRQSLVAPSPVGTLAPAQSGLFLERVEHRWTVFQIAWLVVVIVVGSAAMFACAFCLGRAICARNCSLSARQADLLQCEESLDHRPHPIE